MPGLDESAMPAVDVPEQDRGPLTPNDARMLTSGSIETHRVGKLASLNDQDGKTRGLDVSVKIVAASYG